MDSGKGNLPSQLGIGGHVLPFFCLPSVKGEDEFVRGINVDSGPALIRFCANDELGERIKRCCCNR